MEANARPDQSVIPAQAGIHASLSPRNGKQPLAGLQPCCSTGRRGGNPNPRRNGA